MNILKRIFKKLIGAKEQTCECGEHRKCVRKIRSTDSGKLYTITSELFSCGKVKKQLANTKRLKL